ncbi:NAD-dependent succinate-semialdehyde dehydrogenase [Hydrogenophaga sp. OTU3427]|uniref:NAD-dependent succinate-semialdehyde dehydrogenase n=1 Tax=Hydrogenophaga sp. OTU3427 TaxID=3043856 RepID=UPI00313AB872
MLPFQEMGSALIGGSWVQASDGRHFDVANPFDATTLAQVADCGAHDAEAALSAASTAFDTWSTRTAAERSSLLLRWHDRLVQASETLARTISLELGKTIRDSRAEVSYGNGYVRWFAEEARRVYGTTIPSPFPGRQLFVTREPVGVVAIITPWNFPYAMLARKIAPALAAGCTVVVRPAEDTPLTALYAAQLAIDAGIPPGVINVAPSSRERVSELSDVWMRSDAVRKVSFTGSTPVGKGIAQRASTTLKRLSLELGGNAPFIVFDDADVDAAVQGAVAAKFRNSGQTCISPNRFFVHQDLCAAFTDKLTKAVSALSVGDPSLESTDIGPLVNAAAVDKVQAHVQDAVDKGAKLLFGGQRLPQWGPLFFQPTVLLGLTVGMRIFHEETFGPVIAVMPFSTEAEVLDTANQSQAGLAAYFYTRDSARIWRVGRRLRVGMVGVNEALISTEVAPFGGVKDSGYGREGSYLGLDDYLETKYMCLGGLSR